MMCSERFKELWKDPDSVYNTEEYRKKLSVCNKISQNDVGLKKLKSLSTHKNRIDPDSVYNTEEYRKKHKESMLKLNSNRDYVKKKVEGISKNYVVTDPTGNQFTIKNLAKFCRDNKLSNQNMCAVSKGRRTHCNGWKCYKL